ncbi:MAG: CRISPR-associated RAMP protein Csx7 [bacterium]
MFKRLLNQCTIDLKIRPQGALLIKSGIPQVSDIDMVWVKVIRNGEEQIYLPGSSLKGMIRAHAERIARTSVSFGACDPFGKKHSADPSCSDALGRLKKEKKLDDIATPDAYKRSCPICRLFGNMWIAGRLATNDAYVDGKPPAIEHRDGVGIDRFSGGASHGAKFEMEVITSGAFKTSIQITNFELWQLGLLAFVLQDMKDGLVRLGLGKSRGLGKIIAEIDSISLNYFLPDKKVSENGHFKLYGAGAMFDEAKNYGFVENDVIQVERHLDLEDTAFAQLRQTVKFNDDDFPWREVAEKWVSFIDGYMTDPLAQYRKGKQHG